MSQQYFLFIFYLLVLIIASVSTYFIHLPTEFLIGVFGLVLGSGLPSIVPISNTTVRPL